MTLHRALAYRIPMHRPNRFSFRPVRI